MLLCNLALLAGAIGRAGRRRQPAARAEQRAGRGRHGLPARPAHRLRAGRRRRRCARASSAVWGARAADDARAHAAARCTRRRARGEIRGHVRASARTWCRPIPTRRHAREALERARVPGGAGAVPVRDREARARRAAGRQLPREGRHLHERRAPHPARAPRRSTPLGRRAPDWEILLRADGGDRAARSRSATRRTSWTRSRASRRSAPASRTRGSRATASSGRCRTPAIPGTRDPARASVPARPRRARAASSTCRLRRFGERPLTLVTGRVLEHYNAGTMTRRTRQRGARARTMRSRSTPVDARSARRRIRRPRARDECTTARPCVRARRHEPGGARHRVPHVPLSGHARQRAHRRGARPHVATARSTR